MENYNTAKLIVNATEKLKLFGISLRDCHKNYEKVISALNQLKTHDRK